MSTEHHSTSRKPIRENREIRSQARIRDRKVLQEPGRSGLNIDGRPALKKLLADVQDKVADYSAVLIYDISRWGRFQDIDESAFYEFIIRRAGVQIAYCAEPFENDGSPISKHDEK